MNANRTNLTLYSGTDVTVIYDFINIDTPSPRFHYKISKTINIDFNNYSTLERISAVLGKLRRTKGELQPVP